MLNPNLTPHLACRPNLNPNPNPNSQIPTPNPDTANTLSWERAGQQWDFVFQNGVHGQGSVDIDKIAPLDPSLNYAFAYPPSPPPHFQTSEL